MANIDNIDDAKTVRELEVNDTAYDIVGKGVLDQNNRTTNLEWIGTKAEYEALGAYSDKCTYIITDDSADSQSDEVGAIAEEVNTLKGYDYVVDWQMPTSANSYTWYRKYKSGWVEQGGRCTVPATNANTSSSVTVKLPVPISDAAAATLTYNGTASTAYYANCEDQAAITTTSVIIGRWNNGSNTADARYYNWNLSGMAA